MNDYQVQICNLVNVNINVELHEYIICNYPGDIAVATWPCTYFFASVVVYY